MTTYDFIKTIFAIQYNMFPKSEFMRKWLSWLNWFLNWVKFEKYYPWAQSKEIFAPFNTNSFNWFRHRYAFHRIPSHRSDYLFLTISYIALIIKNLLSFVKYFHIAYYIMLKYADLTLLIKEYKFIYYNFSFKLIRFFNILMKWFQVIINLFRR